MALKEKLPASMVAVGRLLRTKATLLGLYDRAERRHRLTAVRALVAQRPAHPSGRRVLIFGFRGWYPHVAWESIIAHALRLRGVTVHVFSCGGPLPICEVNFRGADPKLACAECAAYPRELVDALGLAHSWLRDYVDLREQAAIRREVAVLRPSDYEQWSFAGQPLGLLVRDSVCWFLRRSRPDFGMPFDRRIYRDFLVAGAEVALLAPRLLDTTCPDVVLELNGQFFAERILNRYAASRAAVVAYEAAWRCDTLSFDRLWAAGPSDIDAAWAEFKDQALGPEEEAALDRWIAERAAGDMQRDFYIQFSRADGPRLRAGIGLREDLPTAVLFTNVVWDTAVMGRDVAFTSISDWLRRTIEIFGEWRDRQLIVRIHPAEDLRPSMEAAEKLTAVVRQITPLPENVYVIGARDPTSTYALMEDCEVGLVYTSTAGLEMALRGKPVVVAGRTSYRGRGFTLDMEDEADYLALLDDAFERRIIDRSLARRFAHLLLFRYLHRIPVVRQRPRKLPLLDGSECGLLDKGRDPAFDHLLEALVAGMHFIEIDRTSDRPLGSRD